MEVQKMAKSSASLLRVTGLKVTTVGMLQGTFFSLLGLIVAISEEMDMRWFARSLANTESSLRPETI